MTREEARLSWIQYVIDNTTNHKLEKQAVVNMFDFIDEVAKELQLIIDSKAKEIEKLKKDRDYWKLSFNKQVEATRRWFKTI